jgi:hypothetical protein
MECSKCDNVGHSGVSVDLLGYKGIYVDHSLSDMCGSHGKQSVPVGTRLLTVTFADVVYCVWIS